MVGLLKVKPVCLAALLLAIAVGSGCSSKPDYAFVGDNFVPHYERLADSITLSGARQITDTRTGLSATMLSYVQNVPEADFDYLIHIYSSKPLDEMLTKACITPTHRMPVTNVEGAHFSIDGSPVEMAFIQTQDNWGLVSIAGVNKDYCDGGDLKAVFVSGRNIQDVPWLVKGKRSIHLMRNGRFDYELPPAFVMVSNSDDFARSGLLVVRGLHSVEAPVNLTQANAMDLDAQYVMTPTFFDNPSR